MRKTVAERRAEAEHDRIQRMIAEERARRVWLKASKEGVEMWMGIFLDHSRGLVEFENEDDRQRGRQHIIDYLETQKKSDLYREQELPDPDYVHLTVIRGGKADDPRVD